MTHDELIAIVRLFERSDAQALDLRVGERRLELRKRGSVATSEAQPVDPPRAKLESSAPVGATSSAERVASPAAVPAAAPAAAARGEPLRAPMVGTFYRAPKPGAPPFVEVGARVSAGEPIGIIEVMKVMNTLAAERTGRVSAVLAEDAALVQYGEVLMLVEPD